MPASTDFVEGEYASADAFNVKSREGLIKLTIPQSLRLRKIYCFVNVAQSAAGTPYLFDGRIRLLNQGRPEVELPVRAGDNQSAGGDELFKKSMANMFIGNGSNVLDTMQVYLKRKPINGPAYGGIYTATLQPVIVSCEAEEIRLDLLGLTAAGAALFVGWEVYLACKSERD